MIVVFDLDDTLYEELTFVRSGFRAVARHVQAAWGVDRDEAYRSLIESLERDGRGRQFDALAARHGRANRGTVRQLVHVYRHHEPDIALLPGARHLLTALRDAPLYLVTDGHKVVQWNKVQALGIEPFFRHCYLTNRYGRARQKPSPYVFEQIVQRERCRPEDVVYVGDDPRKDFRGIRPLGFRTIRVLQGNHADVRVPAAQDAEVAVPDIDAVGGVLASWRSR